MWKSLKEKLQFCVCSNSPLLSQMGIHLPLTLFHPILCAALFYQDKPKSEDIFEILQVISCQSVRQQKKERKETLFTVSV